MKKLFILFVCTLMLVPVTACKSKESEISIVMPTPATTTTTAPDATPAVPEIKQVEVDVASLPTWDPNSKREDVVFDPNDSIFTFSDAEKSIYENFSKEFDKNLFKDVSPNSVAKIFIQYGISANWEAEYEMYSKEGLTQTKEQAYIEYAKDMKKDETGENATLSRKEMAQVVFKNLADAVFVEDSATTGHLNFKTDAGEETTFKLIKNADGIWEVSLYPFD